MYALIKETPLPSWHIQNPSKDGEILHVNWSAGFLNHQQEVALQLYSVLRLRVRNTSPPSFLSHRPEAIELTSSYSRTASPAAEIVTKGLAARDAFRNIGLPVFWINMDLPQQSLKVLMGIKKNLWTNHHHHHHHHQHHHQRYMMLQHEKTYQAAKKKNKLPNWHLSLSLIQIVDNHGATPRIAWKKRPSL